MSKIDSIKLKKLIHSIGLKYNLTDDTIKQLVESPYEFTAEKVQVIKFEDIKTEEDLQEAKTNFLYKAFGKIYVSFPILKRRIDRKKLIINLNKENGRSK